MKKILIYIAFLVPFIQLYSQESGSLNIVFKIKSEYRAFCTNNKIEVSEFQRIVLIYNLQNVHKLFPQINAPSAKTNKFGDSLVDISLIYQADLDSDVFTTKVCQALKNSGIVEYAQPKNTHIGFFTPNDPLIANQYYLNNIRAFSGWDISKGDSTVVVGITDSGFDFSHLDLTNSVAYNQNDVMDGIDNDNDGFIDNYRGWDLSSNDNNPQLSTGNHGLFVSAIVSARSNNSLGITGVGYNTKILPIKVSDTNGVIVSGYEGIVYAATHGCSVINCSWGGQITDGEFGEDIVNYATYNCNALVVAACGNSFSILPLWPASYRNVLSVSATDVADVKWVNSSYGWNVDIAAPGNNIYSAIQGNGYTYSSGTSFAAPMVAASAAILKSYFPTLSALQIGERLRNTADNIDTISANVSYAGTLGNGRLNLFRALTDLDQPAIRYEFPKFSSNSSSLGDTITFSAQFKNFSIPTTHLNISLSVVQGDGLLIDSSITTPIINTMQIYDNQSQPFKLLIESTDANSEIILKLSYADTNYLSYEYVTLYVNKNYITVDTNHIKTTFTGNSRLGFADNIYHQGEGFNYLNTNQLFYEGGLLIGKSTTNVSDNIYGETSTDEDFVNSISPVKVTPSFLSDFEAYTQYNDNGAAANKMNLHVTHRILAWDQPDCEDFIIHSFLVKNTGITPQTGLFIGLFVDWDIYLSTYNRAKFDSESNLIYAWSPQGGKYGGIAALSNHPINNYAFDSNGNNLSLKISDGFSGIEKFTALTSNRDSAGYSGTGNDISTLLSYGQINLNQGDTITLNFALIAGNSPLELKSSVNAAILKINPNHADINNNKMSIEDVRVYPNPAIDKIFIDSKNAIVSVELYSLVGVRLLVENNIQSHNCVVNITNSVSGIYVLKINTLHGEIFKKLVINP